MMMQATHTTVENLPRTADAPAVSVVIPAYGCAAYIGACLDSVFAQTFKDFETIVVNDGSPDTPEFERAIEPYRERINYVRQENRGPAAARNAAVMLARGRYVAFLDADDLWLPDYLAEQLRAFEEDPALDLVYADALLFGGSRMDGQTFMELHPSNGEVTLESLIDFRVTAITTCVVARREAVVSVGLFDEEFTHAEDFHLWARLAQSGHRLGYQRRVLARHRVHDASLTANKARLFEGQLRVYRKLSQMAGLTARERELLETQMARSAADLALEQGKASLVSGQYEEAAAALARANDFYRSGKLRVVLLALRAAPRLLKRVYELRHGLQARRVRAGAGGVGN